MAAATAKDKGNIVWLHPTDVTLHLDGRAGGKLIVGDEKSSTLMFPCISVVASVPVGRWDILWGNRSLVTGKSPVVLPTGSATKWEGTPGNSPENIHHEMRKSLKFT